MKRRTTTAFVRHHYFFGSLAEVAYHRCVHVASYSFFDSYDVELLGRRHKRPDPHTVGKSCLYSSLPVIHMALVVRKIYPPARILRKCLKEAGANYDILFHYLSLYT